MPHDELGTIYANALIDRAILNKCNSYILDYVYSRSVLLNYALVHLGFYSIKRWRISLMFSSLPRSMSFYKINTPTFLVGALGPLIVSNKSVSLFIVEHCANDYRDLLMTAIVRNPID